MTFDEYQQALRERGWSGNEDYDVLRLARLVVAWAPMDENGVIKTVPLRSEVRSFSPLYKEAIRRVDAEEWVEFIPSSGVEVDWLDV